jgi:3-oxoadipate enol-lactonase
MQYHAFTVPVPEGAEEIDLQTPANTRLAEIHVPALIIVGDYYLPDMQVRAQQLVELIPAARQVIIPGVAHMVSMSSLPYSISMYLHFCNNAKAISF